MEVKITITDGGVTTEQTVPRSVSDAAEGVANAIRTAMASGAMNAGPAPSGLSATGMEGPMPFVTGAQEVPGSPGQSGPGSAPDHSAGPAPPR
jgi:hypothetical protein